jgi:type III pantothenate kinase
MTLGKTFRYQGERMLDFILSLTVKERPEIILLSSVRNFTASSLKKLENQCDRLLVVDESLISLYGLPSWLTPDRVASIVASRFLFKNRGCTIFDFGTVLSIDFLDGEGNFLGGNISLGCRTRFKALNRYSRTLPLIGAPDEIMEQGIDVVSAVSSGVITSIMSEIEGYISKYPENITVFTGGDAIYFAKRMKNSIFVVCNLVLMGLALMAVEYDKKD